MTTATIFDNRGFQPIDAGDRLEIGQVVSYEDMANPRTEYVVVSDKFEHMGQRAISFDGTHEMDINRAQIEGLGGHKLVDRKVSHAEVEELVAKRSAVVADIVAKRRAADEERGATMDAANEWWEANKPNWAKAILIAEHEQDESDLMSDYWGSKTTRTVLLAWSKHTRDLFPEMRKAAAKFDETVHLSDAPKEYEHREKYSMGGGYYLGKDRYSGWKVSKLRLDVFPSALAAAANPDDRAPIESRTENVPQTYQTGTRTPKLISRISKHYHTKRETDFWLVTLNYKVDRSEFIRLRKLANALGGWYSRQWEETPGGFAFLDQHDALSFADQLSNGNEPSEATAQKTGEHAATDPVPSRLRSLADRMEETIDAKLAPLSQNWTPKRGAEHSSRVHDGENMQEAQAAMRVLADAREAGTMPGILASVKTKKAILKMFRTRADFNGTGYLNTGEYHDQSPEAIALRKLLANAKSPEQIAAAQEAESSRDLQRKIDALRGLKIPGFFPTPAAVVDRMLEEADINDGQTVLEPSAGIGSIADRINASYKVELDTVEIRPSLVEILQEKGHAVEQSDFLEMGNDKRYNRIVMNPPFEKGADWLHVRHAYEMLELGGRLVALMANGPAFHKNIASLPGANFELLDSNSFAGVDAFNRTSVNVNLVTVDKPDATDAIGTYDDELDIDHFAWM